jgi:diaminohydroxyphosphoribosylaminopyrimidine deaminase / 5-amino-6-(5-phosphoribosylamino)uracil reductase
MTTSSCARSCDGLETDLTASEVCNDQDDLSYMAQALALAHRGLETTDPNPRVGCVLVKSGRVIGRGWHHRAGGPHAEIEALASASESTVGATCYVSLEPCCHHGKTPPCTEALIAAGVRRVVAAMPDPNPRVAGGGLAALAAAGIESTVGVLAPEARELNPGFCKRFTSGLPYVRLKLGLSLDGRTAMASGQSQWITSVQSRQDVQRWRARSSAVLTGINTVIEDDPRLNVRDENDLDGLRRQPVRVVLDSRLRLPKSAKLLDLPGRTWIFTTTESAMQGTDWPAEAEVVTVPAAANRVDLVAAIQELARREINEVWVEAGATLSGALLQAGLVDELVLYVAPSFLGHDARPALRLENLVTLSDRFDMQFDDVRRIGTDLRITAKLHKEVVPCSPA